MAEKTVRTGSPEPPTQVNVNVLISDEEAARLLSRLAQRALPSANGNGNGNGHADN
jgi:hypothetical protein